MKNQFVNKLSEGDYVNDVFIAARNDLRSKQDGGKFLGVVMRDRTGEIGGVMWNNAAETSRLFNVGDVVNVRGDVRSYQNRLQIHVESVTPLKDSEYDVADLVYTPDTIQEDLRLLRETLETVKDKYVRALFEIFWQDADFVARFTTAAAAKKWHHEYRGGLVRHCYEMARIADTMCELFPNLNRDILLAGVFLHDLGKLYEMSHDMVVDYTDEGKLLGHLHIGAEMAARNMGKIPGFPAKMRLELLHLILSHHGELQYGSPVVPKTLEGIVLHHIDNLDAQTAAISRVVRETAERGQAWSEYLPQIERVIWTKQD
ncbi:MAG: HD domain-containing protein [Candidatus Hydrogenedentes bacterium]|nr:HD domain-containing protein [Candidatus Hydrogenedentota bacterium]